jgi:hypothetical protein
VENENLATGCVFPPAIPILDLPNDPFQDDGIDDRDKQDNLVMDNKLFEAYYAAQGIMGDTDWTQSMVYLRRSLPITFRFSGSRE